MVSGLVVCGNDDRIGALNKQVKHNDKVKVSVIHPLFVISKNLTLKMMTYFNIYLLDGSSFDFLSI